MRPVLYSSGMGAGQRGIAGTAGAITVLLGRLLWLPARLAYRPIAAKQWDRHVAREIERRPRDRVKVFDRGGALLGWGVRQEIDPSHTAFAVPFGWFGKAATVKDRWDNEIRGALFYFGKSAWVLHPIGGRG
jgi:hypothetical protein